MGSKRLLRFKDPIVQDLLMLAERKEHRLNRKRCVVSGTKLVRELGRRYRFHEVLTRRGGTSECEGVGVENIYEAEDKCLRGISQLTRFDGLVGTLDLPAPSRDLVDPRLVLCLDHIYDPGLLGTLLRTAMAFQWQAVFFLPDCVDPFDAKCVRASQGALFELPHARGTIQDLSDLCRRKRLQLCVSHAQGVDIGGADYMPPAHGLALLLREEYATAFAPPRAAFRLRVPDPWRYREDQIPEAGPFDPRSLDVAVAGGILMHHIKYFHYPHVSRSPYLASPD